MSGRWSIFFRPHDDFRAGHTLQRILECNHGRLPLNFPLEEGLEYQPHVSFIELLTNSGEHFAAPRTTNR